MVIGEENSSVSNLIVQNIHTLSHISPSKHIYIHTNLKHRCGNSGATAGY